MSSGLESSGAAGSGPAGSGPAGPGRSVRLRFSKTGKLRWISHRDVARLWERTMRRAGVQLAYSAGFSPHPKLSFGLALPTGAESTAEYLDAELAPGSAGPISHALGEVLPDGVAVLGEIDLVGGEPSLQQAVVACGWEITVPDNPEEAVGSLLAAESVVVSRERKGQAVKDDIRPAVLGLSAHPGGILRCVLATQPRGLRPSELLAAMGFDPLDARVLRTHQWIERDGAWHEPVPVTDAPARPEARFERRDPDRDGTHDGGNDSRRGAGAPGAGHNTEPLAVNIGV